MNILLDPTILFFIFGIFAGLVKSNLEIPQPISRFLSLYLLMALGLKGGFALDIVQGQGRFSTQGVFGIGRVNTNVLTDWTNFTVTCSPKEVILYRDGLKLITVPVTMKIDKSNAIRLGQGFSGVFDEDKIFNGTLDEETVKKLYLSTYYQLATTK